MMQSHMSDLCQSLTLGTFLYMYCRMRLNTSSENYDFGFNSLKNQLFKIIHLNALGKIFLMGYLPHMTIATILVM